MIIEYELQGSKGLHKGICDTNGFWVRFEEDKEFLGNISGVDRWELHGYKLFSHFSFSFFHTDKDTALDVYEALKEILSGCEHTVRIPQIGYIGCLD